MPRVVLYGITYMYTKKKNNYDLLFQVKYIF